MTLTEHGDARVDDWFWLRERDDPAVRAHLEAENAYAASVLAPSDELRERIFGEIKARIEETDISAPVPRDDWEYVTRTVEGLQYAIHARRPRGGGEEHILLDENVEAEGHPYFALGGFAITPDHAVVAYSVDTSGGERYALHFRDLTTGRDFTDVVEDVTYGLAWADDARTCFYVRLDDAMRPWQVWRHELGTEAAADVLVFQEDDERFYVTVHRTRSGGFVLVDSASKTQSEIWFVPANDPTAAPAVVAPREVGLEYTVEHHRDAAHGERFLVVTNADGARNFKLVAAPTSDPRARSLGRARSASRRRTPRGR